MAIQETSLPDPNGMPNRDRTGPSAGVPNSSVSTLSPSAAEPAVATAQRVGDAATSTLSAATDATKDVLGEASEQTHAVVHEARAQAHQVLADTQSEIQQQADARSRQAAEHLRSMSGSIVALLDGRPADAQQVRGYLEHAKSKMDDVANRIETRGPQGVIDDLSQFARRRPGTFLLVAGVAGFAVGRLARAGATAAPPVQQSSPRLSEYAMPGLDAGAR